MLFLFAELTGNARTVQLLCLIGVGDAEPRERQDRWPVEVSLHRRWALDGGITPHKPAGCFKDAFSPRNLFVLRWAPSSRPSSHNPRVSLLVCHAWRAQPCRIYLSRFLHVDGIFPFDRVSSYIFLLRLDARWSEQSKKRKLV